LQIEKISFYGFVYPPKCGVGADIHHPVKSFVGYFGPYHINAFLRDEFVFFFYKQISCWVS